MNFWRNGNVIFQNLETSKNLKILRILDSFFGKHIRKRKFLKKAYKLKQKIAHLKMIKRAKTTRKKKHMVFPRKHEATFFLAKLRESEIYFS